MPGNPQKPGRQGMSSYAPGAALAVFETGAFDRSATHPYSQNQGFNGVADKIANWHPFATRMENHRGPTSWPGIGRIAHVKRFTDAAADSAQACLRAPMNAECDGGKAPHFHRKDSIDVLFAEA